MTDAIVWLRRDLRLSDNVALYEACSRSARVWIAFVLNPPLLESERMGAPLRSVFFDALAALREDLRERGSDLVLLRGDFAEQLCALAKRTGAQALYYNEDYEPEAIARDAAVTKALEKQRVRMHASLDHVYFGADEVVRPDGAPYRMFTPYKRRWLDRRAIGRRIPVPSAIAANGKLASSEEIGETQPVPAADGAFPRAGEAIARRGFEAFLDGPISRYAELRDFPQADATSRLSPQLRAGTIGIRTCVESAFALRESSPAAARTSIDAWISELVWREFYQMILRRFPSVATSPFLPQAERIAWDTPGERFERWCEGKTGYPIVDAAMRQLNTTGWMHNRLRMITASFLTKHLLVDWRMGERYFETHLADADLAQNNGGWQWAASTGTDAVPYFRIFNPTSQSRRFDPDGTFLKRMLPELEGLPPEHIHEPRNAIVEHAAARARALAAYGEAFTRRGFKNGAGL